MHASKFALAAIGALFALNAHSATYILHAAKWGASQDNAVRAAGGTLKARHAGAGVAIVQSDNPGFLAAALAGGAIAGGAADRVVSWIDPVTYEVDESAVNPADDRFFTHVQWAPQAVDAPGAWALGYTGAGVRVAVIDGGIYDSHADLAGAIDVAASRSFVEPDPAASATVNACRTAFNCDTGTFWHGTHVSGIIAARDNAIGVVGIAPDATIVGVKALHGGSGTFEAVIDAIMYAADEGGASIINMSLGAVFARNEEGAAQLRSALNKAVNYASSKGVLVVVAAGNDEIDLDHAGNVTAVPAESGNAIAISATGPLGFAYGATDFSRPASYTNYGNSVVWVSGPGGDAAYPGNENCTLPTATVPVTIPCWAFDMVISTSRGSAPTGGYTWAAGTSMATPAVSAVAALVRQKQPGISVGALKNRIAQSAVDAGKNGHDPFHGRGFVNALNAVSN